ncbi:MAG TPA: peptidase MA family metallohydrolase [Longimicrobiales bacterium]
MMQALAALVIATASLAPQTYVSGPYRIHSWTASSRLAERVVAFTRHYGALPGLPANAPAFGQPIDLYLAPNTRAFRELTGGRAPEWGAGVAAPEAGIIVLRAYGDTRSSYEDVPRVLRHELAHIALHRYLGDAVVPRWFDEGYAEFAANETDSEGAWLLRIAFATQRAPPLDSLELSWPVMSSDARIAYLLAASVVQYLVRESGPQALTQFLQRWRSTQHFEQALAGTYGLSLDQLELHWRRDVKKRYGWLAVVTQTSVAFAIMAVLVLVLFIIRRRRDRARLAILKATELPDEPAYWNEAENAADPESESKPE